MGEVIFIDTKTNRTLTVSMLHGPEGETLDASGYVAWLDRVGYLEGTAPHDPDMRKCVVCGKQFIAPTDRAEYCGKGCRSLASRRRLRQAKSTPSDQGFSGTQTRVRAS